MKNAIIKRGYGLIAALALTILVAGPIAPLGGDIALYAGGLTPNGDCQFSGCVK